jgi:GGDEF domain-containing protein
VRLIHNLIAPEFHGTGAGQAAGAENAAALASVESTNGDKSGEAATAQKGGEEGEEEATGELDSDTLAIQSVFRSLCRPETGLFTYPAFLYFVDQEWRRFRRGGLPFSLMIFQISYREVDVRVSSKPLSIEAIHEAALRITATKRDLDLLAHYGAFDFAVLLPHTEADGAAVFAGRVQQALTASPLVPGLSADGTMLYGGIAQMPGDSDRPRPLIGAALEAKKWAVSGPSNIVLYRDLYRR